MSNKLIIEVQMKKLFSILLILNLLTNNIFGEGFVIGTLIKTTTNYIPIEQLKENDSVVSFDFKKNILVEGKITKVRKTHVNKIIKLVIKGEILEVAADHKFYCPLVESSFFKNQWVKAENLKPNQFILCNVNKLVKIDNVIELTKETSVYSISIKDNHNFLVSRHDILVHNFLVMPFIYSAAAYVAAHYEVQITMTISGILIGAIGTAIKNNNAMT